MDKDHFDRNHDDDDKDDDDDVGDDGDVNLVCEVRAIGDANTFQAWTPLRQLDHTFSSW